MKRRIDIYDREILRRLLRQKPATSNEIANNLKISWNTAQGHLNKLERLGLVATTDILGRKKWKPKR